MIDGHMLGLPGGSPGLGADNPGRLGAYPQAGKPGLQGLGGPDAQVRGGGIPAAERRGSLLRSPDIQAGSPAMEGFIQDWLKAKGVAKEAVLEAQKHPAVPEEGLAVAKTLQPKETVPTETSAPEPASRTSAYNRRAWEIARAARQAAIDAAAEAAARATSNLSASAPTATSPEEEGQSTPMETAVGVTAPDGGEGGGAAGEGEADGHDRGREDEDHGRDREGGS